MLESSCYGFRSSYSWTKETLSETGSTFVDDLLCVADLLGFKYLDNPGEWLPGKPKAFLDHAGEVIAEFRAFKNGNMHIRMSQRLALALNVAVGKLRGWLRDAAEAKDEFGEVAAELGVDVEAVYNTDLHTHGKALLLELRPVS